MEKEFSPEVVVESGKSDEMAAIPISGNKPIVGWFCTYLPEEILYAGGLIPERIIGTSSTIGRARACLAGQLCSYVMSSLDGALEEKYDFLSGIVITNCCDAMRRLYDAWRYYLKQTPFVHILDIPKKIDKESIRYFRQCLIWLKEAIEAHYKVTITEQALRQAIEISNETRRLLSQLYSLRKRDNPPIKGSEASNILRSTMSGLREETNKELSSLLEQLKGEEKRESERRIRILLSGGYIDEQELIKIIEYFGGEVVCEDLCTGLRYFHGEVDINAEPLSALAERYLVRKPPCARMIDTDRRLEQLWNLIAEYKVDGIIYCTLKFCDTNLFEFPYLRDKLKEKGMPVLFLESEGDSSGLGQLKTRIQAFLEVLVDRRTSGATRETTPVFEGR